MIKFLVDFHDVSDNTMPKLLNSSCAFKVVQNLQCTYGGVGKRVFCHRDVAAMKEFPVISISDGFIYLLLSG